MCQQRHYRGEKISCREARIMGLNLRTKPISPGPWAACRAQDRGSWLNAASAEAPPPASFGPTWCCQPVFHFACYLLLQPFRLVHAQEASSVLASAPRAAGEGSSAFCDSSVLSVSLYVQGRRGKNCQCQHPGMKPPSAI